MSTINQLSKNFRSKKKRKIKSPSLFKCPQKRGICLKLFIRTPKKPNSAKRKVSQLRLSNKTKITAYIPGQIHQLQEHSNVLVKGGRIPDLPGVKYRLIRNKMDLDSLIGRITSRSKYGTKKPKL
uniref:ribosomal protein S12 n=1 Tax=Dictyotopsis propagulifera TaxID=670095 RepID=UPI002E79F7D4|nr:ribosomal protein S12 [Dictyotopsis propagulifera]WBP69945.1 ribosomal protein S12 [Dictyotopsis propagulifera]